MSAHTQTRAHARTRARSPQAAYLALTQLLDYHHELVLLLVNTLLSDLKSDNFVVCCSALVVTCKLIGPDLVNAVYPIVVRMNVWCNCGRVGGWVGG